MLAASSKLSLEYFTRVRVSRCFYALKYAAELLQPLTRDKKKEYAFERPKHEALLKEVCTLSITL